MEWSLMVLEVMARQSGAGKRSENLRQTSTHWQTSTGGAEARRSEEEKEGGERRRRKKQKRWDFSLI